jgi:hypothetical protein
MRLSAVQAVKAGTADPSWWFPSREDAGAPGGSYGRARRICSACPVRVECLEAALVEEAGEGFRTGMRGRSANERAVLARQRRRAAAV